MGFRFRTVTVKQVPEMEKKRQASAFLEDFKGCLKMDRPRVVLNCSNISTLGRSDLHLLLCCLEEVMKRNGDVRLSSVPDLAFAVLEATGIDRLFRIYENDADAIMSFQCLPISAIPEAKVNRRAVQIEAAAAETLFENAGDPVYCGVAQGLSGR